MDTTVCVHVPTLHAIAIYRCIHCRNITRGGGGGGGTYHQGDLDALR